MQCSPKEVLSESFQCQVLSEEFSAATSLALIASQQVPLVHYNIVVTASWGCSLNVHLVLKNVVALCAAA